MLLEEQLNGMVQVEFTSVLKNFFPTLQSETVEAANLKEVLKKLDGKYEGIAHYIVDETGKLREHVKIYIGGEPIPSSSSLDEPLANDDKIYIFQAISGG
jgi:molybdopterin converting factor small subunit